MRQDKTKGNGIIREVGFTGNIYEYTCKNGVLHGLIRLVTIRTVEFKLMKNGQELANIFLDHDIEEHCRGGPEEHLLKFLRDKDIRV